MGSMWDDILDNAMGIALPGHAVLRSPLPSRSPATPAPRPKPTDNAGRTEGTAGATLVLPATAAAATPAKIPRADAAERVSFWAAIRAKVPEAMVGGDAAAKNAVAAASGRGGRGGRGGGDKKTPPAPDADAVRPTTGAIATAAGRGGRGGGGGKVREAGGDAAGGQLPPREVCFL